MAANYADTTEVGSNPTLSHHVDSSQDSLNFITIQNHGDDQINHDWSSVASDRLAPSRSTQRMPNEVELMRSRRVKFNHKTRKNLEYVCEDKVSKYKLEEVHTSLRSSIKSTFIMTFSPDGQRVASTHGDHRIYICDLNTGKLLDTLEGHSKIPWCIAWHPINRDILASGCLAGEVRVWNLKLKASESCSPSNTMITSLDFHPKERILVVATANDIHFWDWSDSQPFAKTTTSHDEEKVKFVLFDSTGTKLITGISNLSKFPSCIGDSLQNRIIDTYSDSMASNNEPTGVPFVMGANRQPIIANINEQCLNPRVTMLLHRIDYLYRNLESLEDSLRHTSFSPYITSQIVSKNSSTKTGRTPATESSQSRQIPVNQNLDNRPPQAVALEQLTSCNRRINSAASSSTQQDRSTRLTNALEPFVVAFDEFLANLRLTPITVNGQQINIDTITEQFPSVSHHSLLQHVSISRVNQNFIRISKLMSSIRLYRQVVQQITSSNTSQDHYQPNQILTIQSMFSKSSAPIVSFKGFSGRPILENLHRGTLPSDPIMAIQFRSSARNVPLMNVCKIDLLISRSVFIMRSQQLLEQIVSNLSTSGQFASTQSGRRNPDSRSSTDDRDTNLTTNLASQPCFFPLLDQLHQSLVVINRAPLTTSNVHTHISSLRSLLNNLLTTLIGMFQSQDEGERLIKLINDIAHGLTGRNWKIPLGATLNDILLDVIHTVCVVDLTLHLTRHVQLVQLQRLSALARIEESPSIITRPVRSSHENLTEVVEPRTRLSDQMTENNAGTSMPIPIPGTSRHSGSFNNPKRKEPDSKLTDVETKKKTKLKKETNSRRTSNLDTEMIETPDGNLTSDLRNNCSEQIISNDQQTHTSSSTSQSSNLTEHSQLPNFIDWSSGAPFDTNLPRIWFATAATMNTSQMLWRTYQHFRANTTGSNGNSIDNLPNGQYMPHESRRRALSQDNTGLLPNHAEINQTGNNEHSRGRQLYVSNFVLPQPISSGTGSSSSMALEPLLRNPIVQLYHTRPHHIWFNNWTIPVSNSSSNSNYRLQCWNFSLSKIPNIEDSHSNLVTQKCRIHNNSSIDISHDGRLLACLVPRDDACVPCINLKIFSLKSEDFGVCYHQWPHGANAMSVSLSPSTNFVVVGLDSNKSISHDPNDDDLTIAKVLKLRADISECHVRDIKIKRADCTLQLNAIRWLQRGIVYNVGPHYHHLYRQRNRVV